MPEEFTNSPEAGDVAAGGEPVPAQPDVVTGEPGAMIEQPADATPGEPVSPEAASTAEDGPDYTLPGQDDASKKQADFYRQKFTEAVQAIQGYQQKLEEYEMAGLDDDEKESYLAKRKYEQLEAEMGQIRMEKATNDWRNYYSQFAPKEVPLQQMNNPIEMQHQVLIALQQKNAELQREAAAMKQALAKQQKSGPVTSGGSGPPSPETMWSLNQSPEELEKLFKKAQMGLLR